MKRYDINDEEVAGGVGPMTIASLLKNTLLAVQEI